MGLSLGFRSFLRGQMAKLAFLGHYLWFWTFFDATFIFWYETIRGSCGQSNQSQFIPPDRLWSLSPHWYRIGPPGAPNESTMRYLLCSLNKIAAILVKLLEMSHFQSVSPRGSWSQRRRWIGSCRRQHFSILAIFLYFGSDWKFYIQLMRPWAYWPIPTFSRGLSAIASLWLPIISKYIFKEYSS